MNCLCAIYFSQNQRAFLAQITSFVVQYDVIYISLILFPISSQYLLTWGVDSPGFQVPIQTGFHCFTLMGQIFDNN